MLNCPRCRNPLTIRSIEVAERYDRVRLSCDTCRREIVQEVTSPALGVIEMHERREPVLMLD